MNITRSVNKSLIPYQHEVNLKDDKPVISKPRILPQAYEKDIYIQINELLDKGAIEISDSPYASPIVPLIKRDGSIRLCCDYRKLNEENDTKNISNTKIYWIYTKPKFTPL